MSFFRVSEKSKNHSESSNSINFISSTHLHNFAGVNPDVPDYATALVCLLDIHRTHPRALCDNWWSSEHQVAWRLECPVAMVMSISGNLKTLKGEHFCLHYSSPRKSAFESNAKQRHKSNWVANTEDYVRFTRLKFVRYTFLQRTHTPFHSFMLFLLWCHLC